jgi:4-hydroxythreonine-4-phosphate dehydrogenase
VKTRILLTVGDYNGIGPEIILRTLSNPAILRRFDLTVVSPVSVLEFYSKRIGRKIYADKFNIIPIGYEKLKVQPGKISEVAGFISGIAVIKAIELCMSSEYDAVVTAPISKEALNKGGFNYDGHTEILADFGKVNDVCMIMVSDKLKTALATTHPPLKKVALQISKEKLQNKLRLCYTSLMSDFNIASPETGVLAVNPHAGEKGLIGKEESEIIDPVIRSLNRKYRQKKFFGSFAADAYFASGLYRKFDLTFAMYHDQGLIPFKMIAGFTGINYTAGLRFVRTSPDHGTAFDIAGKNKANEKSFLEAIKWADRIHKNRNSN